MQLLSFTSRFIGRSINPTLLFSIILFSLASLSPLKSQYIIGGVDMGKLPDYLFYFSNGVTDAKWQSTTKGYAGNVAVNGLVAKEGSTGAVPYAGTIYTNASTLSNWANVLNQNQAPTLNPSQAFASYNEVARLNGLKDDFDRAMNQIKNLSPSPGYAGVSSTSLNGLNTQNGVGQIFVINITSGLSFNTKINITGDANDFFILRWDTDGNPLNGYQGVTTPNSGGAIVPNGGLKPSNFINVAGSISSSGSGTNPPAPYPQGPRLNNGTGALIANGTDFAGGGFFTGYWLTTGDVSNGENPSFANGIFVGGWYSSTTRFTMTSGTSGVHVAPPAQCVSVAVSSNSPVCAGTPLSITSKTYNAISYNWSGPAGFISNQPNVNIASPTTSNTGWYYLTVTGPGGCTAKDSAYVSVISDPKCGAEYSNCFVCTEFPDVNASIKWTEDPAKGTITIRTTFSKNFVDNTYGTTQIGWPSGHTFGNLTGSDKLGLFLYDANGALKMDLILDYISASSDPSGYGTLGVSGGEGKINLGSGSDVLNVRTSISENLNVLGYPSYIVNSPATDANYTPNPATPNWIYDVWYEVTLKSSAFGPAGFGRPSISEIHASPSKKGQNSCLVEESPTVEITGNPIVCLGREVNLSANVFGADMYSWKGPNGFTSSNLNIVFSNATTALNGWYILTVKSSTGGCTAIDSIQVEVLPEENCEQGNDQCFICSTFPDVYGHISWTENLADGTVTIRTTFSKNFVDNTYGTTQIGWPSGHTFGNLTGSDKLGLYMYDKNGVLKMHTILDYISSDATKPSGYGTLGVTGGEGKLVIGTLANVVSVKTSISENLNVLGYPSYIVNSPATDANYTPNPMTPNWIYDVWYEITVKTSQFGASGFGYPMISEVHASPSKKGENTCPVSPVNCPLANASGNAPCVGDTIKLFATTSYPGSTYKWKGPNNFSSTLQNPVIPNAQLSMSGIYTLEVTLSNITLSDQVNIQVKSGPMANAGTDRSICLGSSVTLTAAVTGGTQPYTMVWTPGNLTGSSITVSPQTSTTYKVVVTDANGCTAQDEVFVRVDPRPLVDVPDLRICLGNNGTLIATGSGGTPPYTFSWNQGLGTGPSKTITPQATTNYVVTITDANGCTATDQAQALVLPSPNVSAGVDKYICAGTSTTLTATATGGTQPYTFTWSNGLGTGASKTVTPTNNTTYTVTVSDANQCTKVASVTVYVTGPCPCVADLTLATSGCDPSTNFYNIAGQITFVNPPTTGTLTVTTSAGGSQVFSAPFVSPIGYNIGGLNSDGANRSVTAVFSADPSCTKTVQYVAPPPCKCVIDNLTAIPGPCDPATNFFTLTGQVFFRNPPTTGTLVITIPGIGTQTFFPPFGSPLFYSIGGLNSDGSTKTVLAYFTAFPTCSFARNFNTPVQCKSGPNITHSKELVSINQTGARTYSVQYKIDVRNIGGSTGLYNLSDQPNFDDDIAILGASYTSLNVPGLPGGALAGNGPWTLATQRSLDPGFVHTYNITIQVRIDLSPGSSGNNIYTRCGQATPGDPTRGEGLFNESFLDKNNDGVPDEIREACGDLPYIVHTKTISSVVQTGPRAYRVLYNIQVNNLGGADGRYNLSDQPNFDNDLSIVSSSYTSTAPGVPGGALAGTGPWTLATNQLLGAGGSHNYAITVNTLIDLSVGSGGDNVYRNCGTTTPGIPQIGEGLFNQSFLDVNNDGIPDENKYACGDVPYITHQKTFSSVVQTGPRNFRVVYRIDVTNRGGVTGNYTLTDAPSFDNDITINSASYTSTAPGVPGGPLAVSGTWTLATNQSLASNGTHSYFVTVNVTLDLSSASTGDRTYRRCGQTIPGRLSQGEGLYNQSKLDVNNDGVPDEFSDACGDIPYIVHQKTVQNVIQTGTNTYQVVYQILVRNIGGVSGNYSLVDQPVFDDDLTINGASYTSNAPGNAGGPLAGTGPWSLASNQALGSGGSHTYTLNVQVTLDLNPGSTGDNVYRKCGFTTPGTPRQGEGLFNRSLLDVNNDGQPDEFSEVCEDIPSITHRKEISSIVRTGAYTFRVTYRIVVENKGGSNGRYGLTDRPFFDDDIAITSASFITDAPGNPGGILVGSGPWTLASGQSIAIGGVHTYTLVANVIIDLNPTSGGDNVYRRCGQSQQIPVPGEGLFNRSLLDVNEDGIPDEIREVCGDIPYITHQKTVQSVTQTGANTFRINYNIVVRNLGGTGGSYDLTDAPAFDDDLAINSASYVSDAFGNSGGVLAGTGPWFLANNQAITAGGIHTYTLTVNVTLDLSPASSGNNQYRRCGQTTPGVPTAGEGLFNRSLLDLNDDGTPEEISTVCEDIPLITHRKEISGITRTGPYSYRVSYRVIVENKGGLSGRYGLTDRPIFDDDITINSASYTSNAPGNPGSALVGTGPWTLATAQTIGIGVTHTYNLNVDVTIDLRVGSGGDNVYRSCGQTTPGRPIGGEGLFNRSLLDVNEDGVPDEISEVCGDIPYITHQKSSQGVTQTGPNSYQVIYSIVVRNLGGAAGSYSLTDAPAFDDDINITGASYISNAPGNPGSALIGTGPWVLATNQSIGVSGIQTYFVTVNVTLDLAPGSPGDNVYRRCGAQTPGTPTFNEGLFNRSLLDVNNDGTPDEISTACDDLPQLTHRKEISSIVRTGAYTFRVVYRIIVENRGGVNGTYSLTDRPFFDDDIAINSASYTSDVIGIPGSALAGSGPWTLASFQNIGVGATHTYTLTVNITIDLRAGSSGNNVYTRCGQTLQGTPSPGEGLFNRSLLDTNGDGIADEIREVCGDIPYITHLKTIQTITSTGVNTYRVDYQVQVRNIGGTAGNYTIVDSPVFDDDINILSASYTSDAPTNPGLPLGGPGPWLIANNISLNAGGVHTYTVRVNVSIDLRPISGGDNVYTRCGQTTPGIPRQGEGLFNRTALDVNNDGTPDEFSEVCGDLPYITHQKTVQSVTQTGPNTFRINYNIVVRNLGGVSGSYGLSDAPAFDNDLTINSASYTSNAPGFPGSALAGTGPWTLAINQALAAGGVHTYTVSVNVTLDLSPTSSGDKVYRRCGQSTPGIPTAGEGLFNRSLLDVNNDGNPDEISTACDDLPQLTHRKELSSIVSTGLNTYRVTYRIVVENKGGVSGRYTLTDRPIFDDDIAINNASYTSDVVGIPGGPLFGSGPWTLASLQNIAASGVHTYTLVVNVTLDLRPGSSGNNVYTRCGQAQQGIPSPAEGLFNRSLLDVNDDGIADEIREVCGDIPYIVHQKTVQSVTQTGINTYRVNYNIVVQNIGGASGNYRLTDAPVFDDDIAINNASYASNAPGNPGTALAGFGPWQLANGQAIVAGGVHTYTLTVNVTLDLRPVSGGDNVYRRCGQTTPGIPRQGEGLFNRSALDANNDGTPDEFSEVCEDIPYITHQKTVQSVTQTGTNTFRISYNIVVRNLGGVSGSYGLSDAPAFDNDLTINSASYNSNAPGFPGSALFGSGPWTLATNQALAAGGVHTYTVTVNVTLDLSPSSRGDKVYRRCGQGTPGVPTDGEGLFNRSLLDVNNDGNPDEISTACDDLPQLTHRKELVNITNTGLNTYRVTYRIVVENKGGVSGRYTLTDRPIFDDDIAINSASYTSDAPGVPGSGLFGTGPWNLATLQNIGGGGIHTYTLVVNVSLDLRTGSSGNNVYTRCGQSQQGIPSPNEGLFNRSLLDVNDDGIADEIREVCGDIPYIDHNKQFLNAVRQPNGSYNVSYSIQVCNSGGAAGTYSLNDRPAFDDDVRINNVFFVRNFALPGTVLSVNPPLNGWTLATNASLAAGACDNYILEFNLSIDLEPGSGGDNVYRACGSSSITPRAGEGLFNESLLDLTRDGIPDQRDTACRDIPYIVHNKRFVRAELKSDQTYDVIYEIEVCNQGGLSGQYDLYDKPDMDDDVIINTASYQSTVHGPIGLSLPVPGSGWLIGNDIFLAPNSCHTYTLRFNLSIDLSPGSAGDNVYRKCGETTPGIPRAGDGLFNQSLLDLDNDGNPEQRDTACFDIITGLGDCVWNDQNFNGIQDIGEPGIRGVHVNLYRCDGTWMAKDTTDNMGKYFFFGIPGNQSYYVVFDKSTLPSSAFDFTRQDAGTNDALDSDVNASGRGPCIFLPPGKIDSTYDAGVIRLATIGNFVWLDKNGNGLQDYDEEGVEGVKVTLFDATTRVAVRTETTDMTGYYLIRFVRPGNYYLKFEWPSKYGPTISNAGNDLFDSDVDGSNGVMTTATTELTSGELDLSWDLGLVECALIGGRVFLDANSDGIFNTSENGINGLRINLVDVSNNRIIQTFITRVDPSTASNDGWYEFSCVPPGSYFLQFEKISQLTATQPYVGFDPTRYSYITNERGLNTTRAFNMRSGDKIFPVNGGFINVSSLANPVVIGSGGPGVHENADLKTDPTEPEVLRVYPVPAQDVLTLEYWLNKEGQIVLQVFDQEGREVLNRGDRLYRPVGRNEESLDLNGLPNGQYFIQIRTASGLIRERFTILR